MNFEPIRWRTDLNRKFESPKAVGSFNCNRSDKIDQFQCFSLILFTFLTITIEIDYGKCTKNTEIDFLSRNSLVEAFSSLLPAELAAAS
jgi:hypothetical protein